MTSTLRSPLAGRHFLKMNGLGNDFVVIDGRRDAVHVTPDEARAIADRQRGIGFDQLVVLEPSARADAFMRILNADGSEAGACGNATRCVGRLLMQEGGRDRVVIDSEGGLLEARDAGAWDRVRVDMGPPRLGWQEIPLGMAVEDTTRVPFDASGFAPRLPQHFTAVSMGNPHAIFFVENIAEQELERIGPIIERHPLFPARVNVSLAQVLAPDRVRLRVWERGAGLTLACGTAACATLVAGVRTGLTARSATIELPGGALEIAWREADGHVLMTGGIALEFEGAFDPAIFTGSAA